MSITAFAVSSNNIFRLRGEARDGEARVGGVAGVGVDVPILSSLMKLVGKK